MLKEKHMSGDVLRSNALLMRGGMLISSSATLPVQWLHHLH